jgi:hypothetical protein
VAIYALCPAGDVTGGPETMHQFVHKARGLGLDAYIHYYGSWGEQRTPEAYSHYDVETSGQIVDSPDSVVIAMEIAPFSLKNLRASKRVIWWLSVDNFLRSCNSNRAVQAATNDRDTFDSIFDPHQTITHLTHSEYGRLFLASKGVNAPLLGDYISDKFTSVREQLMSVPKKDRIAYNPRKGKEFTEALIRESAGTLDWLPIQGMTAEGVAQALAGSKVYIDFGEHPGQDHLPKEAALAGCSILTGTRGAAGNKTDIPIPPRFKINEASQDSIQTTLTTIRFMLDHFSQDTVEFDPYRSWILSHEDLFVSQIIEIFGRTGILSTGTSRR